MFRITSNETAGGLVWTICGQLAGPFVSELRTTWEQAPLRTEGRKCLVDLSDVTFIDESGALLLRQMRGEGVEFIAAGVDTSDVVEHLGMTGKRPLRWFMAYLRERRSQPEED